jgi:hypothetical protein
LKLGKAECPVFVVVAFPQNVFDDPDFLLAGQVFVVVKDQPVNDLPDVVAT